MAKERVAVKKKALHVCSGGRKVERKTRRLVLSDSESDGEDKIVTSQPSKGSDEKARDSNGVILEGDDGGVKVGEAEGDSNGGGKKVLVASGDEEKECGYEKTVLRSDVDDKKGGGEGDSCKKTPPAFEGNEKTHEFQLTSRVVKKLEMKRVSRSEETDSREEQNREERMLEAKRVSGTEVRERKEADDDNKKKNRRGGLSIEKESKKVPRSLDLVSCMKRSREPVDTETRTKKIKSEQHSEIGGKCLNKNFIKQGYKMTDIMVGRVSYSKPEVKSLDDSTEKINTPETENSGAGPLRKLKDKDLPLRGVMRKEVGISRRKPFYKKVRLDNAHINRGHEINMKRVPDQPSISGEGKVNEKSSFSVKFGSKQPNSGKGSAEERTRPNKAKTEPKISSPKTKLRNIRPDRETREEHKPKLETCTSSEQNMDEGVVGKLCFMDKQKIREQIKRILLDAGWSIDLRPRRGKDYVDAVYIPPFGGAGYWSVTNAYDAYVKNCKSENDERSKKLSGKSPKIQHASDRSQEGDNCTFSAIPTNLLDMLKRNVINKRRQNIEKEKTQKKLGVRKEAKGTICKKDANNKKSKNDSGGDIQEKDNVVGKLREKSTEMVTICLATQKANLRLRARNQNKRGVCGADEDARETDLHDYIPYAGKRTVFSWMIDLGILHAKGKVTYMNEGKSRAMIKGWITRDGIRCSCCTKILTVSKFEIHADSKLCQPYQNIYVEDRGMSLLQCLLNAWEKEKFERLGFHRLNNKGDDPNDDTCGICADGGDVICCDFCPSSFHLNCLGIEMPPSGDWHCTSCSCKFCGLVNDSTTEGSVSTICPLLTCSQCEKKYHQECIPEISEVSIGHNIADTSFCGQSCYMVFNQLQKLLGIKNDLEAGLSWRLICRLDKDSSKHQISLPQWAECNSKSAVAFAVMDECFLPIIDQRSGINLVKNIVYNYGSNIARLNYNGFYTFILEREDEVIAAASVRIHGTTLAEMPFIGTRNMYRRQGMCRQLLKVIESALCSLDVEKLIIPATSELKETWVNGFGFKPLDQSHKQEIGSINMLVFPDTGLLLKPIPNKESADHHGNAGRDNKAYVQSNLCGSNGVVFHTRHEVKDVNTAVSKTDFFGVSHDFECQDPKFNSSEAADVDFFVENEVYHNALMGDDEFQITYFKELKTTLPCEGTMHADHKGKNEDAAVASIHQQSLFAGNRSPVLSPFQPNLTSDGCRSRA